eukprot:7581794-Pyramimonas_sp.AAC.1
MSRTSRASEHSSERNAARNRAARALRATERAWHEVPWFPRSKETPLDNGCPGATGSCWRAS